MEKRKLSVGALLAFFILHSPFSVVVAAGLDYANPPQGVFLDDWAVILLNGQKCGYAHFTVTRKGDTIQTMILQTFKIGRAGQGVGATQLLTTEETLDGRPLSFASDADMAVQKVRQQGVVRDGKVTIRSEQYGNALSETFDYPPGALMNWGMLRLQEEKGYRPGTAYEVSSYVPILTTNQAVTIKVKIEDEEEIAVADAKRKAVHTTQEILLPGMPAGIHSTIWVAPQDHQPLKTTIPLMGMMMEMVSCARVEALADFEAPEAFMTTLVKVDKPIDRQAARRIRMKLTLTGDGPDLPPLPKTGMQTPSDATSRSVELEVTRQDHAALAKADAAAELDQRAFAEFLAPNIYINSDDSAVRKMAEEATGAAKTPYEIADRLRRYVSEKITNKNLTIGFATASEVARNMAGDCSEHGVLLAALGRAKGLPSRVVCGLVYVPWFQGADRVFGFHMWTQFYIAGQWVDFDAAQNETDCNPTHITLAVDSLHDSGLGEMAFALFPVLARLNIEVLAIEPAPSDTPASRPEEKGPG